MKISQDVEKAHKIALEARENSHSPYSKFAVGAALKVREAKLAIGGCNVENASFGGTVCAERVAVLSAVATHGKIHPEFLIIVTAEKKATVPCAFCLQVLAEFCPDDMPVYLANQKSILKSYRFKDFLPHPFRAFKADKK